MSVMNFRATKLSPAHTGENIYLLSTDFLWNEDASLSIWFTNLQKLKQIKRLICDGVLYHEDEEPI